MLYGIKAWQVFICSYFGILLTSWNQTPRTNVPQRYADADEAAGFICLFPSFSRHHMLTALVLYLLFTRSSSAAHHVVKNRNEISLNSIFAPYGFAEAVAPFKQSAVPSGHCGFCPSPPFLLSLACRSVPSQFESRLTKTSLRVSLSLSRWTVYMRVAALLGVFLGRLVHQSALCWPRL